MTEGGTFFRGTSGAQSAGGISQVILLQADGPHGPVLPLRLPAARGCLARSSLTGGAAGANAGSQTAGKKCH